MHKRYSKAQKNGNKKWKQPFTKIATAVTRTRKVDALQGMNALEGLCPSLTPLVAEHRELPGVGDLEALQRGVTFERFSKHFAALVANVMSEESMLQTVVPSFKASDITWQASKVIRLPARAIVRRKVLLLRPFASK